MFSERSATGDTFLLKLILGSDCFGSAESNLAFKSGTGDGERDKDGILLGEEDIDDDDDGVEFRLP